METGIVRKKTTAHSHEAFWKMCCNRIRLSTRSSIIYLGFILKLTGLLWLKKTGTRPLGSELLLCLLTYYRKWHTSTLNEWTNGKTANGPFLTVGRLRAVSNLASKKSHLGFINVLQNKGKTHQEDADKILHVHLAGQIQEHSLWVGGTSRTSWSERKCKRKRVEENLLKKIENLLKLP